MAAKRAARTGRSVAGTIGLVFGGLWFSLGAMGLPRGLQLLGESMGFLVTIALIAMLWSRSGPAGSGAGLFRRRGYIIAVALEVVAIYIASTLLARNGLRSYLIQAVGVIVGLHFIGLWQATRLSRFLWIAGSMCVVSTVAVFLPNALDGLNLRGMVTGFGNALVLWIGAGQISMHARSNLQKNP